MEFSMKDSLRASVEFASNGKNTVLYDEHNNPSIMVIIPRFKKEHIDPSLGTGTHEAFIVHGREVPEIFYPKYANTIPDWIKSLCIFPYDTNTEYTSSYSVSLDGERLPMRGGCYHHAPNSSIFSMHITADRDSSAIGIGSRPVYIDY